MDKQMKITKSRSRNKEECNITVLVEGNEDEFLKVKESIRQLVLKNNRKSDRKMSYYIAKLTFQK